MKVILRADVDSLGRVGDEVVVKPGFARNYLLPQGKAMLATASNKKVFEMERKKLEVKANGLRTDAQSIADSIAKAEVSLEVRVGEGDKMYGSVTTAMIAEVLAEQGINIDKRKILLDAPIRALGEYDIPVKLHPEVTAELTFSVTRQGGMIEEEVEPETEAEAPAEAEAEAEESTEAETAGEQAE